MNIVVYTAIIGGIKDMPHRPACSHAPHDPVRFVCFSNRFDQADGWEVRKPVWQDADPRRTARWHKTHPEELFPDACYSLWHDGTHQLTVDPRRLLVDRYLPESSPAEFASFKHSLRSTVQEELKACIWMRKDDETVMRRQVLRYQQEGINCSGLFETSVVLRKHTPTVRTFDELWWNQIKNGSVRDQLSVNYAANRTDLRTAFLTGDRAKSPYFHFYPHN